MRAWHIVRTARPGVHAIAAGAVVLLTSKVLVLNHWPSYFPGARDLGVAVEGVLASVIASYFFYIVVVHLKEYRDREAVYPFIVGKAQRIVADCRSQLEAISKAAKVHLDLEGLDTAATGKAFAVLNPKDPAPLVLMPGGQYASWMQYLLHFCREAAKHIEQITSKLIYLDAELVRLLVDIQDCSHFSYIETTARIPFNNTDMTAWASTFADYCAKCRVLDAYVRAHLSNYAKAA